MSDILLRTKKLNKHFASTHAVRDFDFSISRGEIRGLIGENGSGKSTFSSMVAAVYAPDDGEIYLREEIYAPKTMHDATNAGIAMIVQEMATIPNITVAANIYAGRESLFCGKTGIISRRKMKQSAREALSRLGVTDIDPNAMIDTLSFEDRKLVEVARAMDTDPELLIIDETTTALPERGREIIYRTMRQMAQENKSVIFISHDLEELMEQCTSVTVMRDGELIRTLSGEEIGISAMRELMVGRELVGSYYRTDLDGSYGDELVLRAHHITCGALNAFSCDLHRGEILGIAGLSECGMHDLGRALFGIGKLITGEVLYAPDGTKITNPRTAIANGIGYISKNRDLEALILNAPIQSNIVMPSLKRIAKAGLISPKKEKELSDEQISLMRIKCRSGRQYASELSGGNKQKVVFAKWLGYHADILVLDCPTRGIDIGVKKTMYDLIYRLKREGKSIVLISEELPEVIGMSDRILVLKDGVLKKAFRREEKVQEKDIIHHMI